MCLKKNNQTNTTEKNLSSWWLLSFTSEKMSGSKWVDQSFSNKWQSQRQIGRLHRQWTILYIIKTLTTSDFFKKNQIKRKNGCLLFIHTQVCVVGFFPLQNEKINWVKMGGGKKSNLILKKKSKEFKSTSSWQQPNWQECSPGHSTKPSPGTYAPWVTNPHAQSNLHFTLSSHSKWLL